MRSYLRAKPSRVWLVLPLNQNLHRQILGKLSKDTLLGTPCHAYRALRL